MIPATAAGVSAPSIEVMRRGLEAVTCAEVAGHAPSQTLTLIDYSLPANTPRLWVIDRSSGAVLFHEHVAHGRGTGDAMAVRFSNQPDSHRSSLGLFRTLETYEGANGYSLRLQGLEAGINDRAYERQIVMHGADYVSTDFVRQVGRLGRSFGCPAVRRAIAKPLIDRIKHGQFLLAYYPDPAWLRGSAYLGCRRPAEAALLKAGAMQGRPGTAGAD